MRYLLLAVCVCLLTVVVVWLMIVAAMPADCGGLVVPDRWLPFCGAPATSMV